MRSPSPPAPAIALAALSVLAALIAAGCGYHLVRAVLPAVAGGCVRFDGMEGGQAHPQVALSASSALRQEIASDLCEGGGGTVLRVEVDEVREASPIVSVQGGAGQEAGGTWVASATVSLEDRGAVVWGPLVVRVERVLLSTGSPLQEGAALEAGLDLLAADLASAVADAVYGRSPIAAEALP